MIRCCRSLQERCIKMSLAYKQRAQRQSGNSNRISSSMCSEIQPRLNHDLCGRRSSRNAAERLPTLAPMNDVDFPFCNHSITLGRCQTVQCVHCITLSCKSSLLHLSIRAGRASQTASHRNCQETGLPAPFCEQLVHKQYLYHKKHTFHLRMLRFATNLLL